MTSVFQRAYTVRDGSEFYEYETMTVEYRDASHGTGCITRTSAPPPSASHPPSRSWTSLHFSPGQKRLARRARSGSSAQGELADVDPSEAIRIVRINGMGMDAKRDAGADRGTAVHRVLEFWARENEVPDLADF